MIVLRYYYNFELLYKKDDPLIDYIRQWHYLTIIQKTCYTLTPTTLKYLSEGIIPNDIHFVVVT